MNLWWLPFKLARLVPFKLRYYIVLNAAVDASTGQWSRVESPGVTIADMLQRMR